MLEFSDITLEIEDLPSRAQAIGEEAGADVMGGFSRAQRIRRIRAIRRARRMRALAARRRRGGSRRRPTRSIRRRPSPRRRGNPALRRSLLKRAAFHSRTAASLRSKARRV